jgi:hypothetical protein
MAVESGVPADRPDRAIAVLACGVLMETHRRSQNRWSAVIVELTSIQKNSEVLADGPEVQITAVRTRS